MSDSSVDKAYKLNDKLNTIIIGIIVTVCIFSIAISVVKETVYTNNPNNYEYVELEYMDKVEELYSFYVIYKARNSNNKYKMSVTQYDYNSKNFKDLVVPFKTDRHTWYIYLEDKWVKLDKITGG